MIRAKKIGSLVANPGSYPRDFAARIKGKYALGGKLFWKPVYLVFRAHTSGKLQETPPLQPLIFNFNWHFNNRTPAENRFVTGRKPTGLYSGGENIFKSPAYHQNRARLTSVFHRDRQLEKIILRTMEEQYRQYFEFLHPLQERPINPYWSTDKNIIMVERPADRKLRPGTEAAGKSDYLMVPARQPIFNRKINAISRQRLFLLLEYMKGRTPANLEGSFATKRAEIIFSGDYNYHSRKNRSRDREPFKINQEQWRFLEESRAPGAAGVKIAHLLDKITSRERSAEILESMFLPGERPTARRISSYQDQTGPGTRFLDRYITNYLRISNDLIFLPETARQIRDEQSNQSERPVISYRVNVKRLAEQVLTRRKLELEKINKSKKSIAGQICYPGMEFNYQFISSPVNLNYRATSSDSPRGMGNEKQWLERREREQHRVHDRSKHLLAKPVIMLQRFIDKIITIAETPQIRPGMEQFEVYPAAKYFEPGRIDQKEVSISNISKLWELRRFITSGWLQRVLQSGIRAESATTGAGEKALKGRLGPGGKSSLNLIYFIPGRQEYQGKKWPTGQADSNILRRRPKTHLKEQGSRPYFENIRVYTNLLENIIKAQNHQHFKLTFLGEKHEITPYYLVERNRKIASSWAEKALRLRKTRLDRIEKHILSGGESRADFNLYWRSEPTVGEKGRPKIEPAPISAGENYWKRFLFPGSRMDNRLELWASPQDRRESALKSWLDFRVQGEGVRRPGILLEHRQLLIAPQTSRGMQDATGGRRATQGSPLPFSSYYWQGTAGHIELNLIRILRKYIENSQPLTKPAGAREQLGQQNVRNGLRFAIGNTGYYLIERNKKTASSWAEQALRLRKTRLNGIERYIISGGESRADINLNWWSEPKGGEKGRLKLEQGRKSLLANMWKRSQIPGSQTDNRFELRPSPQHKGESALKPWPDTGNSWSFIKPVLTREQLRRTKAGYSLILKNMENTGRRAFKGRQGAEGKNDLSARTVMYIPPAGQQFAGGPGSMGFEGGGWSGYGLPGILHREKIRPGLARETRFRHIDLIMKRAHNRNYFEFHTLLKELGIIPSTAKASSRIAPAIVPGKATGSTTMTNMLSAAPHYLQYQAANGADRLERVLWTGPGNKGLKLWPGVERQIEGTPKLWPEPERRSESSLQLWQALNNRAAIKKDRDYSFGKKAPVIHLMINGDLQNAVEKIKPLIIQNIVNRSLIEFREPGISPGRSPASPGISINNLTLLKYRGPGRAGKDLNVPPGWGIVKSGQTKPGSAGGFNSAQLREKIINRYSREHFEFHYFVRQRETALQRALYPSGSRKPDIAGQAGRRNITPGTIVLVKQGPGQGIIKAGLELAKGYMQAQESRPLNTAEARSILEQQQFLLAEQQVRRKKSGEVKASPARTVTDLPSRRLVEMGTYRELFLIKRELQPYSRTQRLAEEAARIIQATGRSPKQLQERQLRLVERSILKESGPAGNTKYISNQFRQLSLGPHISVLQLRPGNGQSQEIRDFKKLLVMKYLHNHNTQITAQLRDSRQRVSRLKHVIKDNRAEQLMLPGRLDKLSAIRRKSALNQPAQRWTGLLLPGRAVKPAIIYKNTYRLKPSLGVNRFSGQRPGYLNFASGLSLNHRQAINKKAGDLLSGQPQNQEVLRAVNAGMAGEKLENAPMPISKQEIKRISEQVFRQVEARMKSERQRRGLSI